MFETQVSKKHFRTLYIDITNKEINMSNCKRQIMPKRKGNHFIIFFDHFVPS